MTGNLIVFGAKMEKGVEDYLQLLFWGRIAHIKKVVKGYLDLSVTKARLGYDPLEVDVEDMVHFAKERPQIMALYSASNAVSIFYLYMACVRPYIFSLVAILPLPPDEVLRKTRQTLFEILFVDQAHKANVICPTKHSFDPEKFQDNLYSIFNLCRQF